MWRVPERVENDLLRHLGRSRTIRVAAHSVNNDEQRGMLRYRGRNPVLVLLTPA